MIAPIPTKELTYENFILHFDNELESLCKNCFEWHSQNGLKELMAGHLIVSIENIKIIGVLDMQEFIDCVSTKLKDGLIASGLIISDSQKFSFTTSFESENISIIACKPNGKMYDMFDLANNAKLNSRT